MEEIIAERIRQFEITYGIDPNGLLVHRNTYDSIRMSRGYMPSNPDDKVAKFLGIPMYRTTDIPENEFKFIL